MERVSVLCVLLLCSLSGAELQDNEISEQRQVGPESVNVSEQLQLCPSDIHAVLRDMSAALAEHRVRIQQLQTLNQEQAATLQEQAAKLTELESKTRDVNAQQQDQAAELNSIKTRTNVTENHVAFLRRDREVGRVAFSASLLVSGEGTIGPFNTLTPLVFRYVVSNIGNAYNPNTGFFTAPVRGVYHFEFYIYGPLDSSQAVGAELVKNGQHVFIAYEKQSPGHASSANGVTLLLRAGDVVFLRLCVDTTIFDNESRHNTFSGHLLFTV